MAYELYFVIFWVALAIVSEVYLRIEVIDDDGESTWPDDDSKAMAKQYASIGNREKASSRKLIRVCYLVLPPLVYGLFYLSILIN